MKKLFIILLNVLFVMNLFSQVKGFGYPDDTIIKTVSLDIYELRKLRRIINDTSIVVNEFNLDSILKKNDLTIEDLTVNNTIDDAILTNDNNLNNENNNFISEETTINSNGAFELASTNTTSTNNTENRSNTTYNTNSLIDETTGNERNESSYIKLSSTSSSSIVFRVQVAASRSPITPNQLRANYTGAREVEYFQEDNWYKYTIAEKSSYKEAIQVKNESGVHHAFVVAYSGNQKLDLFNAIKGVKKPYVNRIQQSNDQNSLVYMIQIAACRSPLSKSFINYIYKGDKYVSEVYEDGWYKYRINGGKQYSQAKLIAQSTNVPDVFIVPLINGKQTTIKNALKFKQNQ